MPIYEPIKKTVTATEFKPDANYSIKKAAVFESVAVEKDTNGFYLKTAGGSVYREGCYVLEDGTVMDKTVFESQYKLKA